MLRLVNERVQYVGFVIASSALVVLAQRPLRVLLDEDRSSLAGGQFEAADKRCLLLE